MASIFISYRREVNAHEAGRVFNILCERFDRNAIFMDTTSIQPGSEWPTMLQEILVSCSTVLLIIGNDWLTYGTDKFGIRRIDKADDWVRKEIKLALDSRKKLIPVLVSGGEMPPQEALPNDIKHISNLQAIEIRSDYWDHDIRLLVERLTDQEALSESEISEQISSSNEENTIEIERDSAENDRYTKLVRGDIFDEIADAAIKLSPMIFESSASRTILKRHVLNGTRLPLEMIYAEELGALRWLDLKRSSKYTINELSTNFLQSKSEQIKEILGKKFLSIFPDFVSLGPGDGEKDLILLKSLFSDLPEGKGSLYYYPYDISLYMLSNAIRSVANDSYLRKRIKIKATCADFRELDSLKYVYNYRKEPNLLLLLGNTMGNQSHEIEFLSHLRAGMYDKDILILEIRLINEYDMEPSGSDKLNKFNFTPLEVLGYSYKKECISYPVSKIGAEIDGTINYTATYIDRDISQYPIILNNYKRYEKKKVKRALEDAGFNVEEPICDNNNTLALFVLSKKINR